jgi:predicted metal-binding protein
MDCTTKIEQALPPVGLNQYAFIDPKELIFAQSVRDMCAMNSCGRYNTNWQCPPGVGDMEPLEKKAKNYRCALLFNKVYPLEDSYDFEGMMAAKDAFTETCRQIYRIVQNAADSAVIMGAGGCSICPECTYPSEPCRFPDEAIASIEACGIDVYAISGKFGFQYINGVNTVTYFGIAFFTP